MRRMLLVVGVATVMAGLATTAVRAGKPGSGVTPVRCQVTLVDGAEFDLDGDGVADAPTIRSDGGGPYVDGAGGVSCNIVNDPATVHYGWLYLRFSSKSLRSIVYPGQASSLEGGPGYTSFNSRGTFEVKEFAELVNADGDTFDVLPFRANQSNPQFQSRSGQFGGDSNFTGYGPVLTTSSVFVFARPDNCTWDVWFDPEAPAPVADVELGERGDLLTGPRRMVLREGSGWTSIRGTYPMAFRAEVKAISGRPCR